MSGQNGSPVFQIRSVVLPLAGLDELAAEARVDGHRFVDRLIDDWQRNINRFDGPGEVLFGAVSGSRLVGIGGLNRDPYAYDRLTGRIRHLYVLREVRGQGFGGAILRALIARASAFERLRLFTENEAAASFYLASGFLAVSEQKATHVLDLRLPEPSDDTWTER